MAKLISLKQNTPEWMEFRRGKIGGSGLGGIWQQRAYTAEDMRTLLESRNFDFDAYLEQLKKENPRKRTVTIDDMKLLLTDDDKEELQSGGDRKIGFYEVLAEQVSIAPQDDEDEMQWRDARDRGHGLEDAAAQDAAAILGKNIAKVGCIVAEPEPDDKKEDVALYDSIYNSPDRIILPADIDPIKYLDEDGDVIVEVFEQNPFDITEQMEVKCLKASKHLMAWHTRRIPEDYWTQKVQYFITNKKLETLYWVFHNPLVPIMPTFILVVKREDLGHWPQTLVRYQKRMVREMNVLKERIIAESDQLVLPATPEKGVDINADTTTA